MYILTPKNIISKLLIIILLIIFDLNIVSATALDSLQLIKELNNATFQSNQDIVNYKDLLFENYLNLTTNQKKYFLNKGYRHLSPEQRDTLGHEYAYQLGNLYETTAKTQSELDSSIYFYQVILDYGIKTANYSRIGGAYNLLGAAHNRKGAVEKAINYYKKSIETYKKSKTPAETTYPLSNLSTIYGQHGDIHTSINYTKEALEISKLLPPKAKSYNRLYKFSKLITLYNSIEKIDSAFYYLKKGEEEIKVLNSLTEEDFSEGVLSNYYYASMSYYLSQQDTINAKMSFDKLSTRKSFKSAFGVLAQMEYHLGVGNTDQAGVLVNNASEILRDTSSVYGLDFLRYRTEYYEKIGAYQKSLTDLKVINDLEFKRKIEEKLFYEKLVKHQLDLKQKENKIQLLKQKNDSKSLLIKIVSIGIFGALLLTFFIFIQLNIARKKNKKLITQSEIIDRQSKKIKEESASRETLFGNLSHELRTPLTIITGLIHQLLKTSSRDENDLNNLKLIANNSNQLTELTDQMLDIVKHKYIPIKPRLSFFLLEDLMNYLEQLFSCKAKQQKITLSFENQNFTQNPSPVLRADVGKLLPVFKNLIINAIKYGKNGGEITIRYRIESECLICSVQDQGKGISADDLPFIFDRFYQSTETKSRQGGVGIGLAICKDYLEILNGEIKVESKEGLGTTFFVKVPVEFSSNENINDFYIFPEVFPESSRTLPKIQVGHQEEYVLIVEDNIDLCQYIWNTLKEDYQLSFAHDGKDAIAQIELKIPNAIITDWMMDGMDGVELIQYLKTQENYNNIPILMLTARNSVEDRLSLLRLGVDDYITKPFAPDSLLHYLNHLTTLAENRKNALADATEEERFTLKEEDSQFLKNLEHFILKNISNFEFTLADICKELNISPRHLNRKVKELIGLTPKQYINEIRFREAKRMLENKEHDSVKAVTYSVGFKSEKYFSRNFKNRFGKYPKDFLYT